MLTQRQGHTRMLLQNGPVLAAGGFNSTQDLASAEIWSPNTGSWISAGSMSGPRWGHVSIKLANGTVYASGGLGNGIFSDTGDLYDPATNTWSHAAALGPPRAFHVAALLGNGKVLESGGFASNGSGYAATNLARLYTQATFPKAFLPNVQH